MSRVPSLGPRGEGWVVIQIILIGLTGIGALLGRWPTGRAGGVISLVGAVMIAWGLVGLAIAKVRRNDD